MSKPNTCVTTSEQTDSYFYAWSELGFRPVEWLRVGVAGQRTKAYGGERDIQRGPFAQVTWGPVTIGGLLVQPGVERTRSSLVRSARRSEYGVY